MNKCICMLSGLALLSEAASGVFATVVTSGAGISVTWQTGTTIGWMGTAPVAAVGILNAHPGDLGARAGVKSVGAPFAWGIGLGPDAHGTTGAFVGVSAITAPGVALQKYATLAVAATAPGPADLFLPVSTLGVCTDPVVFGPGETPFWGGFTLDFVLQAGSAFENPPGPGADGVPTMSFSSRVVPGAHADPDEFNQEIQGALDLYKLDIRYGPDGVTTGLVRGESTADFGLSFYTDPANPGVFDEGLVRDRVSGAFRPTRSGSQVAADTYLFSANFIPYDENMITTFGLSQGAYAPDIETPEPASLALLAVGLLIRVGRRT